VIVPSGLTTATPLSGPSVIDKLDVSIPSRSLSLPNTSTTNGVSSVAVTVSFTAINGLFRHHSSKVNVITLSQVFAAVSVS